MLIVTYDISCDKLRSRFAKFLGQYGYRLQYSVFKIKNSKRLLALIIEEVNGRFKKSFSQSDSIIIFNLSAQCKTHYFGYAANEQGDLIFIS